MNNKMVFLALFALIASSAAISGPAPTDQRPVLTDTNRQSKVDKLLKVSGIPSQLAKIPDGLVAEIVGPSAAQGGRTGDEMGGMEVLVRKAFQPERFVRVVKESLFKHYDAATYDHYVALMSDPLVARFTEMEMLPIDGDAIRAYAKELQATPITVARIKLIEAIDEAGRVSEFRIKMTTTIAETVSIASLGNCPAKERVAEIKGALSKAKDSIKQQGEASSRFALAYTYRNASEAELSSYLKAMRDGAVQSVNRRVWDAIFVEMKSGFVVMGDALREMATSASKQQTVFAQRSCDGKSLLPPPGYAKSSLPQTMSAPSEPRMALTTTASRPSAPISSTAPAASRTKVPNTQTAAPVAANSHNRELVTTTSSAAKDVPGHKAATSQRSRVYVDARECLRHDDNMAVIACTERYRETNSSR